MVYDIKTFFGIWFTQCCHVVFVNQESWTSTCGGEGAKVVVVKQKNWKCPGRKAVWEKRERENQGSRLESEITRRDWAGDSGWDTAKRLARLGAWDCWQSSGRERQHRWRSPGISKWEVEEIHKEQGQGETWDESGSDRAGQSRFLRSGWKSWCPVGHTPFQRPDFSMSLWC